MHDGVLVSNAVAEVISILALVSEQVFEGETAEHALCLTDIGNWAGRQDKADRVVEGVDGNADLAETTKSASRVSNRHSWNFLATAA